MDGDARRALPSARAARAGRTCSSCRRAGSVDAGRLDAVLEVARAWRRRGGGPSRCATRRGCATTSTPCSPTTAPRCASTTCSPDHPWVRTAPDWTYVRFHGPDAAHHAYVGRYTGRRLATPAARLAAWRDDGCDVYAYFNNDHGGAAVHDARWLRQRLNAG